MDLQGKQFLQLHFIDNEEVIYLFEGDVFGTLIIFMKGTLPDIQCSCKVFIRNITQALPVTNLAAEKKKVPRRINSTEPYSPQNDLDVHRLSSQLTIISRDRIHSIGELEGKIERLRAEYEQARQELNALTAEQERLTSLIQQAETCFDLSGRADLTEMEQLRLTVSRQSVVNNGIAEKADLDCFRAELQKTEKRVVSVKEQLRKCQQTHTVYSDIAKTYREISQGDYISRLVAVERKRQAAEKSRRKKNESI